MKQSLMRQLAILLLDDEQGIQYEAWSFLADMLDAGDEDNLDIINAVKVTEGRAYLPEGWNK